MNLKAVVIFAYQLYQTNGTILCWDKGDQNWEPSDMVGKFPISLTCPQRGHLPVVIAHQMTLVTRFLAQGMIHAGSFIHNLRESFIQQFRGSFVSPYDIKEKEKNSE